MTYSSNVVQTGMGTTNDSKKKDTIDDMMLEGGQTPTITRKNQSSDKPLSKV